ncbi:MAG TPA: L-seryl-tRNA(Sec) selenium transferase [Desulfobacteraceae bacterium]|nr:L-seryl-tRNA(Sec) selenium transferase [Desulfobacteraceae bacterium]
MGQDRAAQSGRKQDNRELLRDIPKVEKCLQALLAIAEIDEAPLMVVKNSVRDVLGELRRQILDGRQTAAETLELAALIPIFLKRIRRELQPKFRRVINCTGVIIHTNLGRSILPDSAMQKLLEAGSRYSNLEFDLETGKRGSRYSHVEKLLCDLTGAEAGLVVNNNAAAVLIVLETLARGRQVIVSRGQLVEIGGSFRIPEVMARSGAELVEVGATNRTHLRDYEGAMTEETALLLKVHCSNFRIIGFTSEVPLEELVGLGGKMGIPVMEDLGSGCFVDLSRFGLEKEPTVQDAVASGVDVVTFSGDKLLGGPQAGIILGKREIIERIKKNPLNRAMRIDKFTLAGLESILRLYLDEKTAVARIPTLAMIAAPAAEVKRRAIKLARMIRRDCAHACEVDVQEMASRVGGGAMPEQNLPSWGVAVQPASVTVSVLEEELRHLDMPVIGRIEEDRLLLDMRTVADDEVSTVACSLQMVLAGEGNRQSI